MDWVSWRSMLGSVTRRCRTVVLSQLSRASFEQLLIVIADISPRAPNDPQPSGCPVHAVAVTLWYMSMDLARAIITGG